LSQPNLSETLKLNHVFFLQFSAFLILGKDLRFKI
ncbi:unnamed protein product, partial [Arabidopsis halleri]